jgi:hypothetical protein
MRSLRRHLTATTAGAAATGLLLLSSLTACGGGSDDSGDEPNAAPSATLEPRPEPDDERTDNPPDVPSDPYDTGLPDTGEEIVEEHQQALMALALQSGLRDIDPALGSAEDVDKAGEQCLALASGVANPDQAAAERFSTRGHEVTVADGRRINALLREQFCP